MLLFWVASLAGVSVVAGWFAVNAPEASRPRFANLGAVRLPQERPPTPPAPLEPARISDLEADAGRSLFGKGGPAPRQAAGPAAATAPGEQGFRALLAPVAAAAVADLKEPITPRAPRDDFQAAFGIERPRHKQYFGGHLIDDAVRDSDPDASALGPGSEAPAYAAIPRPNPRIREEMAGGTPAPAGEAPAGDSAAEGVDAAAVAAPAEDVAAAPGAAGAETPLEEFILLGVLLRRGDDRALIRTPDGESRRVSLGDELGGGWRVSEIGEDFIRVRRGVQTREVRVPE